MPMSNIDYTRVLPRTSQWRKLLLEDPIQPGLQDALPAFLKSTAQEFIPQVALQFTSGQHAELDRWYSSTAGQGALSEFAKRLWQQMASLSEHAMPAHDARHAMYKVPARSLEYMAAEGVQGWQRVGILGGLLHDHGRWAEERIFGEPGESLIHARLSYLLGKELLDRLEMPELVRQHILLSAIRHTSGATEVDPMPLKLTVSADRDQLYGPEIVLRVAHHMVKADGDSSSFYGEKPGKSILDNVSKYLANRLPGPLFSLREHVDYLWQVLATFVLMCETRERAEQRFAKVVASDIGVPESLRPYNVQAEWEQAQDLRPRGVGPAAALAKLLDAAHVAPSLKYRQEALDKLSALPKDRAPALAGALTFIEEERWAEDQRQRLALLRILESNPSDRLVLTLGGLLIAGWR